MKKKILFPAYSKIALIAGGVLFVIYLALILLQKANIYIYVFKYGTDEIVPLVIAPCVAVLLSAVAVLFYKNTEHKMLAVVLTAVVCFAFVWYWGAASFFQANSTYFEFTSDNQKHEIVVRECSFLLGGWGGIYEKTSFCTMKWVGGYTTDDGYCPFTHNDFSFVWNEKDFELHLPSDKRKIIKMEYIK